MRVNRRFPVTVMATAFWAASLLLVAPPAKADQLNRDGTVVAITDTTVTIKEWAGTYTYGLSPMGRQALNAAQIRPGDEVRFIENGPWGVADNFKQMRPDSSRISMLPESEREHLAVSAETGEPVIGG